MGVRNSLIVFAIGHHLDVAFHSGYRYAQDDGPATDFAVFDVLLVGHRTIDEQFEVFAAVGALDVLGVEFIGGHDISYQVAICSQVAAISALQPRQSELCFWALSAQYNPIHYQRQHETTSRH